LGTVAIRERTEYQPPAMCDEQVRLLAAGLRILGGLSSFLVSIEGDFVPLPKFYVQPFLISSQRMRLTEAASCRAWLQRRAPLGLAQTPFIQADLTL
jgi:hypothetical protein